MKCSLKKFTKTSAERLKNYCSKQEIFNFSSKEASKSTSRHEELKFGNPEGKSLIQIEKFLQNFRKLSIENTKKILANIRFIAKKSCYYKNSSRRVDANFLSLAKFDPSLVKHRSRIKKLSQL